MYPPPPVLLLHEVGHYEEPSSVEAVCAVHTHHTNRVLEEEGLAHRDELLHLVTCRGFSMAACVHKGGGEGRGKGRGRGGEGEGEGEGRGGEGEGGEGRGKGRGGRGRGGKGRGTVHGI